GDRGLHFGVLVGDVYVDPVDYLGPVDQTDAIHLVPVRSRAEEAAHAEDGARCTPRAGLQKLRHTRAPNDNVAVVVAGINDSWSRDRRPRAFELPAALGYERVEYFSYSGRPNGYSKADTRGDIRVAALRLEALMERVARRYPHAAVDLVAHSQGGLVARRYLEGTRSAWDRPRVEHLVTFATPHQGARLAGELAEVERDTITGGVWLDSISDGALPREIEWGLRLQHEPVRRVLSDGVAWAHRALPDPRAVSLAQMAPGSDFLRDLAAEDVVYGTRVLALQDRLDLMVPANDARYPGKINRATDDGWWHARHTEILDSSEALAMAHAFLRDASPPCLTARDFERWRTGSRVSATESLLDEIAALGEEALIGRLLGPGGPGTIGAARQGVRLYRTGGARALVGWIRDGVVRAARTAGDPDAAARWARERLLGQFRQAATRGVLKWGFERRRRGGN
ncbi:MAG: esterase/lipase family protein, partial [Actinomycetota bacterium]